MKRFLIAFFLVLVLATASTGSAQVALQGMMGSNAGGYQSTIQSEPTLLYYWPMQESSGSTLYAVVGGINMNLTGGSVAQAGLIGNCVSFTGSPATAVTASNLALSSYQTVTVEALVNFPSLNTSDGMAWEYTATAVGNPGGFNLDPNDASGVMAMQDGNSGLNYYYYYKPLTAVWHHVAVIYDNTQGSAPAQSKIYIDGILATYVTLGGSSVNTNYLANALFHVASRAGGSYYCTEKMEHLAIYSGALSLAKIQSHAALAGLGINSHTFVAADMTDNGYPSTYANPAWSTLSHVFITTSSERVAINVNPTDTIFSTTYSQLAYRINGGSVTYPTLTPGSPLTYTIEMGSVGTSRTLEISVGLEVYDYSNTDTVLGNWLTSVQFGPQYTWGSQSGNIMYIATPTVGTRLLVYGDSIASGDDTVIPMTQSWIGLERNSYGKNVALEGWGFRSLYEDYVLNGNSVAPLVAQLASYNPANIILTIGTNDYGLACGGGSGEPPNTWTASAFQAQYDALVAGLHAQLPSAGIYLQTPIYRCSPAIETANCAGNTLGDYRTAISNVHAKYSAYTTLIDGTALCSCASDYGGSDGVHPSITGHSNYATHLHALGGPF